MSEERGIPSNVLNSMTNEDILIKSRKLQSLVNILKNLLGTTKELISFVVRMKSAQHQYLIQTELLEKTLEQIDNNTFFDDDKLEAIYKESELHTKRQLINNYRLLEVKYENLTEYYERIDREYYFQILEEIQNNVF